MTRSGILFVIEVEKVEADRGDPAGYVATNDELELVVEADTWDGLEQRVFQVAPDLFELNIAGKPRL